ncbi:MAG: DinB family protein [Candidatus Hodarchaeota archaeon]
MTQLQYIWFNRYQIVQKYRAEMWSYLSEPDVRPDWIVTRPRPYQWSIDEILRHMLASEIRYLHQSFDRTAPQTSAAVPAQWVGKKFFRFKEDPHVNLNELKELFPPVENKSINFLKTASENDFEKIVEAPWGVKMPLYDLLEAFYVHEHYHRGQVHFIITNFRGPPNFEE